MDKRGIKLLFFTLFLIILIPCVKANTYLLENSTWQSGLTASFWTSIALGDVDNDNDLDLAQIGCTGTTGGTTCDGYVSKIYTNNGINLTANSTWQQNLTAVHYGSIAWGDIDNDEDLDLALIGCNNGGGAVAACNNGEQSFIYLNNGTSLVENSTWKGDIMNVWKGSIAFGDIDLDGKLDLVLTGRSSTARVAKVYINNGTSFEENSTWQQDLTSVSDSAIALGDIDNDDKLDLILTGSDGTFAIAKVYINNGSSLVENTSWQQNLLAVIQSAISLGDYNNDGKIDLTLIGHTTHDNHEIYNNTGATFQMIQTEAAGTGDLVGIFLGTQGFGGYDNDGDLDLITSGEEEYTTLYLYNFSGSRFTSYTQDPEPDIFNTAFGPSANWGDLDNDSDLDLVLIGVDSSDIVHKAKVYINNITTPNTQPNSPNNFNSSYTNNQLFLQWGNASDDETPEPGLYYNLRVGTNSSGHQIVSGVYGGGDDNGYFGNMMQRKSISLNIADSTYYWAVQTIDTGLKAGSWSREQRYPLDNTDPSLTVNLPANDTNSSNSAVIFNATAGDDVRLENVSLFANFSGTYEENETNTTGVNNTIYLFTINIPDGNYIWSIRACDYYGSNCISRSNRSLMVDTIQPTVTILAPLNNSLLETDDVIVRASFSDANTVNCKVQNDSGSWYNMDNDNKASGTANYTFNNLAVGIHNLTVNCTDILLSTIKIINFSIDASGQDTTKPDISIVLPLNNSYLSSSSVTLNVNFNDSTNVDCQAKLNANNWQNMGNDAATSGIANYTFAGVSDANHSIYVNCTDAGSNNATSNVSFVVDATYPAINLSSPTNSTTWTSSSTVTFSYNVTDVNIDNCSLVINNDKTVNETTITENITQSFSKSLSNGVYNWSVNCTDKAGNENVSNETRQLTVSYTAPSNGGGGGSGSSGGGGGGGAATVSKGVSASQLWASLEKGETIMSIKKAEIAFSEVKMDIATPATNVEITITKLAQKPEEVKALNNVYQYIEIEKKNIESKDINKADITFKVEKSWLKEQKADEDDVVLNKYTARWDELPTSKVKSDAVYVHYKATTSGFSYFAITVKKIEEEEVIEEEIVEEIEEKVEEYPIKEIKEEKQSKVWTRQLVGGLIIIIGLIGYFYVMRKKKK